jgi:hypothetical protein
VAGGALGDAFDRYVLLAPAFGPPSPVARCGTGGWASPRLLRIVALVVLNALGLHALDGLEAITFAAPPEEAWMTRRYSYRLLMSFGTRHPRAALARARRPVVLVAGADDEQFHTDRYADELRPARPDLDIRLVPGLGHVDLITEAGGLDAIEAAYGAVLRV